MTTITPITTDDWRIWRDLRLRALQDSPEAFRSKYSDWVSAAEDRWRDRLQGNNGLMYNVVAEREGRPVGMASGWVDYTAEDKAERGVTAEVISLWIAPEARGMGVARAILTHLEDWASGIAAARVALFAMPYNERALRLYDRLGFVRVGSRPDDLAPGGEVVRFEKRLEGGEIEAIGR